MKIVIFGLAISWGNGHATLWRGLVGLLQEHESTEDVAPPLSLTAPTIIA